MRFTPQSELEQRCQRLQNEMRKAGIEASLIIQNADLFYLTGSIQPGYLFVPAEGQPLFLVRKNLERAKEESALEKVIAIKSPKEITKLVAECGFPPPKTLALELDVLPASQYLRLQEVFKPAEIKDISPLLRQVRAFKSPYEIEILRDAARLSDLIIATARANLQEGITEIELAARIEAAARAAGHQGFVRMRAFNQESYWGHLISGPDAALPSFVDSPTGGKGLTPAFSQGASRRKIQRQEPVVVDMCGAVDGYVVDQTRILSLGPLPEPLLHAYNTSLIIQKELETMIRPGIKCQELYYQALQIAKEAGLEEHFMGWGANRAAFCGHGVGIELDELPVIAPFSAMELAPGMVFAVEPKFTFPGLGVVGVEDTFAVTENGNEKLTSSPYEYEV